MEEPEVPLAVRLDFFLFSFHFPKFHFRSATEYFRSRDSTPALFLADLEPEVLDVDVVDRAAARPLMFLFVDLAGRNRDFRLLR
jgi:hypothetical protein